MKTSKKLLSLFLAAVMVVTTCSVGFTAFGAENTDSNNSYWNNETDAEAAFESINNLVDYFVPALLAIEVDKTSGKTLGESIGIKKTDFANAELTDIVKSVSPKLIGPLNTVRAALDDSYSAKGKEDIIKDYLGVTNYDSIYDLYYSYLEDPQAGTEGYSGMTFFDLYQFCSDNERASDEKLKNYATSTKEALEVLLAAYKSASDKISTVQSKYSEIEKNCIKKTPEETAESEFNGVKLKDLKDTNGSYDPYALGVEIASGYYKEIGASAIAKKITNPGAAFYYYYSEQGKVLVSALTDLSVTVKAGGKVTTEEIKDYYTPADASDSYTEQEITPDSYEAVLGKFFDKYNEASNGTYEQTAEADSESFFSFVNYEAIVGEDYTKYTTGYGGRTNRQHRNEISSALENFQNNGTFTNSKTNVEYKLKDYEDHLASLGVAAGPGIYGDMIRQCYEDYNTEFTPSNNESKSEFYSSQYPKTAKAVAKEYLDNGMITDCYLNGKAITSVSQAYITADQLKIAAKKAVENKWISGADFYNDCVVAADSPFSDAAKLFFKQFITDWDNGKAKAAYIGFNQFVQTLSDNTLNVDGSISTPIKDSLGSGATVDAIAEKTVENARKFVIIPEDYDGSSSEYLLHAGENKYLIDYFNNMAGSYVLMTQFSYRLSGSVATANSIALNAVIRDISLYNGFIKPQIEKAEKHTYSFADYPMEDEVAVAAVNNTINRVLSLLLSDSGTFGPIISGALEQFATTNIDLDTLKDLTRDLWLNLSKDPISTLFNLVPTLVILIDEVVEPLIFNGEGDAYNGSKGLYGPLYSGIIDKVALEAGNTEVGITTLAFDLNKVLPAVLSYITGDKQKALSLVGDYSDFKYKTDSNGKYLLDDNGEKIPTGLDINYNTVKLTGIYAADKFLNGFQISDLSSMIDTGDADVDKGIAEAVGELATFLNSAVTKYVNEHGSDVKYTSDGRIANKGLNNLFVALPQILDNMGKAFTAKYGIDSDWTYCYGGKIYEGTVSTSDGDKNQLMNRSLEEFKALFDKNDAVIVLEKFVEILIGDQINALLDILNDTFSDSNNKITSPIALVQQLLEALGGLGEKSIITDLLDGLFQMKRSDKNAFTLVEREKTGFVGFSNEACLFLLSNLIYDDNGTDKGLVPFIATLINGKAPEAAAKKSSSAKLGSSIAGSVNSPLLVKAPKTDYDKLLTKRNEKSAAKILEKLDDILSSILKNTSLNGFKLNSNDSILSSVISTVSNYIGEDNTNKVIDLLDDYLECIVGTNASSKTGKVDKNKVYTSANLSNLVIETYTLLENIIDYVFYDSNLIKDFKYKDPNLLIADAIYGIVSPDAVAIRMSDDYSSVAKVLESDKYLNWNDLKGTGKNLGYGFSKGNKTEFYNALGESLNGIAAIVGVVLTASYTDTAKSGNYYSKVLYPVLNSLAKATDAKGVMSPASFNKATHPQKLVKGIITPVSNILSQLYDAPATFLLDVVRGLAGVLNDSSIKSIVGSLTAPINTLIDGLAKVVSYLSPSLAKKISGIDDIKINLPYSKNIVVSLLNGLLKGTIELPTINWSKLAKTDNAAQALLLIYAYVVDTVLDSELLSGLLENVSPEISKMINNLSATEILDLVNELLAALLSPTEAYWTFSEYSKKLSDSNFSYPDGITADEASEAVDQLDELVENIFPLLGTLGVADIEGLPALVNDNLYTNDILTTIAKAVYGGLESNDTIATVLEALGLDLSPSGFAKYLTDKSYGTTFTSAANILKKAKTWKNVKSLNWGFTNGSSKAQTGFINGIAALIRPINGVLAILLAEGGEYSNKISPAQKAELVDLIKTLDIDTTSFDVAADSDYGCKLKLSIKSGVLKLVVDSNNSKDNSTLKVDLAAIVSDIIDSLLNGKLSGKMGTNGYENAIIPILEAFMCDNVKTYDEYISDYNKAKDNLIINVLTPLFGFVNDVVEAPFDTITKVLPNVAYFLDSNGLMQAISNLLAPITAKDGVLGVLNKHGINVDKLIKAIAGKDLGKIITDALNVNVKLNLKLTDLKSCNIQVIVLPLVKSLLKNNGIDITIPDFDLATIASHGTVETVKSAAMNDEGKFTTKRVTADQGEVLVAVLRYVSSILIKNATFLKKTLVGIDAIKKNQTIADVITSVFNQIKSASKDDIVRAVFYFLTEEATDVYYNYTDYKSKSFSFDYDEIDPAFCAQFATQLDGSIEKIFDLLGTLGVADISGLKSLVDDNLYKDSLITSLATGLYGAIDGVKVGSTTLSVLLAQTGIDCTTTGFAELLTDKAYGKQYKTAAKAIGAAKSWKKVNASKISWGVKDRDTFLNALVAVLRPFYGVLDTLLTDGSLGIFNLVSVPGSNGYESAIAPLLEALSVTGLKTDAQLKADAAKAYDNLLLDIIVPLFNKVENILGKPIETFADMLPTFALFMANDGLIQCIDHLLTPISALLDAIRPIVDVNDVLDAVGLDLNALLKKAGIDVKIKLDLYNLPKTLAPILGSTELVPFLNNVLGLIKISGKPLDIELPEIDWYRLASHGTMKTVKSVAKNTQGKYTRKIVEGRQGETLLAVLRYIEDVIIKNAKTLEKLICSIDAVKKNATIVKVLKSIFTNISKAKMDDLLKAIFYFFMGRQTDAFFDYSNFIYKTDYEFSYGEMDVDFCKQLAPMLDGLVGGLLADKGGLLGLITDMVYKDEIVGKLATGLYGAIEKVKVGNIGTLNDILKLVGIDFSASNVADLLVDERYGETYPAVAAKIRSAGSWKNVKAESLSWGVKDRTTFLNALVSVLRPLYGVLDVLLNDSNLSIYDIAYVPGSDGYTSTIVPLLEAFGVYNIKTQYQYREDMAQAYDSILLDILNPLLDKVEDILNAPIEMLADILPNLSLFFANDGLLQIIENLLTPVSALLDAVRPIVDVNDLLDALGFDINALLAKAGLKLNIDLDVYDLTGTLKPLIGSENVVGLLNSILSIIKIKGKPLGIVLPEIDWFKLASHGEIITNEASAAATIGARIHVVADQDETLIAVLRFLIDTINYKDNYNTIVDLIGGLLGDGTDNDMSGVISDVLGMLQGDSDEVIQSLVELLQQLGG